MFRLIRVEVLVFVLIFVFILIFVIVVWVVGVEDGLVVVGEVRGGILKIFR